MLKDHPSRRSEVRTHNRQQLLKHMAIMFTIPFPCQVTTWVRELVDERVRGVESACRPTPLLLAVGPQAIDRHESQPCSKRALALPLKLWDLTNNDEQNILRQVIRFITQPKNLAEPTLNQRQINAMQAPPIGFLRFGRAKPFEETDGSRFQCRSFSDTNRDLVPFWSVVCTIAVKQSWSERIETSVAVDRTFMSVRSRSWMAAGDGGVISRPSSSADGTMRQ